MGCRKRQGVGFFSTQSHEQLLEQLLLCELLDDTLDVTDPVFVDEFDGMLVDPDGINLRLDWFSYLFSWRYRRYAKNRL